MDKKEVLSPIIKANNEMLKHFNRVHADAMARLQDVKTELFELNIRLDEQNRTKNLYAMNANHRKNVFRPIQADSAATQKENEVEETIRNLTERKQLLETRQSEEQERIRETEDQIRLLRAAHHSVLRLVRDITFEEEDDSDGFEFVEEEEAAPDIREQGEQILLLDAFEKAYLATILDRKVRTPLSSQTHRLSTLRHLISTDPQQARLILDEFESQNNGIETTLQAHLERPHHTFDEKRPIGTILDEWIMNFRDKHPEYVLDSSIQQKDETQVIPYIRSLTLIRLLDIFFDNIIRHSGANQIRIRIQISGADVDVHLSDNGIGIHENVLSESPWYSSLHKADKMLFLLDGRLQMTGSADHGTTIRFSLPY